MWRTYFPKARVYGLDIEPRDLREPRVETFCGRPARARSHRAGGGRPGGWRARAGGQADEVFVHEVIERIGAPDVVIDDGSHRSEHVVASFEALFPLVVPGGLYVIEDLQYSFQAKYGGGPPGTAGTSVELVKGLVDELGRRKVSHGTVAGVHVYPRIAFIDKR